MGKDSLKRFYEDVRVDSTEGGVCRILLDGRPVRTPLKRLLEIPTRPLAEAAAGEWAAQGETIEPSAMPLTALSCTAIDLVSDHRQRVVADITAFAEHDLLCYLEAVDSELSAREWENWQPWLEWSAAELGAPLVVSEGIRPVEQPLRSLAVLKAAVEDVEDFALPALMTAAQVTGSLVLALALARGRLEADEAFAISQIDETYQNERWGEDNEAAARRAALHTDIRAAERVFVLLAH